MEILYKDNDIIVCIKPSGLLSAKDSSGNANMQDVLAAELNIVEVYPIHRLDKDVSGVMVYALNKNAAAKLSADVHDKERFEKVYYAVISGIPNEQNGVLEDLLYKDTKRSKSFVVSKMRKGVKPAKLEYEVLSEADGFSLVKILLHTGRTHQIRVQFASRKLSLVGDRKYGGTKSEKGIALRSVSLGFYHPTTNEKLFFERIPTIEEMI